MFKRLILLALVFMLAFSVQAQAPQQIQKALAALNAKLGTSLTLNDFNWSWEQVTYDNSTLGCAVPDGTAITYSPVVTYRFVFEYNGVTYDYRVSADETIIVLCSETAVPTEAPTLEGGTPASGTPAPVTEETLSRSNSLCPAPEGNFIYPRTRLVPGMQARVTPGAPNNVRSGPGRENTLVGEIPGGATFTVISGPSCDKAGFLWWEVEYNTIAGWTAERDSSTYFVEPLPPVGSTAANAPVIAVNNATALSETAKLQGNVGNALAWMLDGTLVASGDNGSEGLWIYDVTQLNNAPRILESVTEFTALDVSDAPNPDPNALNLDNVVLAGGKDGSVRLWDTPADARLVERVRLNGHYTGAFMAGSNVTTQVWAVAYSPDTSRFVSTGGQALTQQNDPAIDTYAILIWDTSSVSQVAPILRGHTNEVVAVAFSPDGQTLYSGSLDGSVRGWNLSDGSVSFEITSESPVQSMVLSNDGFTLAVGYLDGGLSLVNLRDMTQTTAGAHNGSLSALAFSPDDSLLVTGGGADGSVIVWDMTTVLNSTSQLAVKTTVHNGGVWDVEFNPAGNVIATIGEDNSIRLWTITAG